MWVIWCISPETALCGAWTKRMALRSPPTNINVTEEEDGSVKPWSFRLCFTDPYQGTIVADYAYTKLNLSKAAILYDVTSDYSSGICGCIEEH